MKNLLALSFLALFAFSGAANAKNTMNCVDVTTSWGTKCGSGDSMHVVVKNRCHQRVYVKMCVEKKGGGWSCGSDSTLDHNERNTGFWACHATGNYRWNSCTGGYKECGFKKPR